jgi:hypothetical protein
MEDFMDKVFVVKRVAEQLWRSEDAVDGAIGAISLLMGDILEARRELKIAHAVVDPATTKVAAAIAAMAEARRAVIEAHDALSEAKLRIGVRTKMDGYHKMALPAEDQEEAPGDTAVRLGRTG